VLTTARINKEQLEWLKTRDELKGNEPRRLTNIINPSFPIPSKFHHYCLIESDPYSHYMFLFFLATVLPASFILLLHKLN
jgi:hypothetical protein